MSDHGTIREGEAARDCVREVFETQLARDGEKKGFEVVNDCENVLMFRPAWTMFARRAHLRWFYFPTQVKYQWL